MYAVKNILMQLHSQHMISYYLPIQAKTLKNNKGGDKSPKHNICEFITPG